MTTIPILLQPQYSGSNSTLAACLQVTRRDGVIERFTGADVPLVLTAIETPQSGVDLSGTYSPVQGLDVKSLVSSASLAVDNTEMAVLAGEQYAIAQELVLGLWDRASFVLFECNYLDPSDGVRVFKRGTIGDVRIGETQHVVEFRGNTQALQQTVAVALSKTCRNRFGRNDGVRSFCPIDLADWTDSVPVSAVTSRQVFTVTTARPTDWAGNGELIGTSGDNLGFRRKIKTQVLGVITLAEAMPFTVAVADTFDMVAGCRLRFAEDCRDKFDVALDFNGEPWATGQDVLTAPIPGAE